MEAKEKKDLIIKPMPLDTEKEDTAIAKLDKRHLAIRFAVL